MYKITFYRDKKGNCPVRDFIDELRSNDDKNSTVNFNKVMGYIDFLEEQGIKLGEPYIKHIDGDIWELRPIKNRVLFAAWGRNGFILLHQFVKKTRKTPPKEIIKARKELADYRERNEEYEKNS